MAKYRKRPAIVDAEIYDGTVESAQRLRLANRMPDDCTWATPRMALVESGNPTVTRGSTIEVLPGDWVVTQDMGGWEDRWPVRPDIFAATYEPVESEVLT